MKALLLSATLVASFCNSAPAYEVAGSKPICIVYVGSEESCPHCAAAAANGVKAVRGSAEVVVIKQVQAKDKTFAARFTPAVQEMLAKQPTNAWVSFNVYDPDMKTLIASI